MSDQRVGASFRAVRVKRRWRQSDVAERAGVSRAYVSLIERGHLEQATVAMLRRVAGALDMRVSRPKRPGDATATQAGNWRERRGMGGQGG
jgi:transcriptional regulator with XRE-family HTH domain